MEKLFNMSSNDSETVPRTIGHMVFAAAY